MPASLIDGKLIAAELRAKVAEEVVRLRQKDIKPGLAVVLIGNDLNKFVETVHIAQDCRRIILQNFWGTIIVDTVGIGLAAVGILNPLLATFIHVTSELIFILNSNRLLPSCEKVKAKNKARRVELVKSPTGWD